MENKAHYFAFEIVGNGWRYNISDRKRAEADWKGGAGRIFYGVKEDGTREEIAVRE